VISVEADIAEGFEAIFSSGEAIIMLKQKENGIPQWRQSTYLYCQPAVAVRLTVL